MRQLSSQVAHLAGGSASWSRLVDVRPAERRVTLAAFLVLFGGLAAHTILETARDALFLARLSSRELPWMYLAMAALAVLLTRTKAGRLAGGRSLPALQAVCAGGTLLFWATGMHGPWALRALYVWTGLVATLVVMAFWLLLGEIYTIAQARRLYGAIGLGAQLGAMTGAAVARGMTGSLDTHHLIAASAAVLLLTAIGPARVVTAAARALHPDVPVGAAPVPLEPMALGRNRYLALAASLVLLSTIVFTLGDYVFKSAVAENVEPARLGRFFATFYLTLNALSVAAQILLSGWLMRVLGVSRALALLPLLVLPGAIGVAAGAGLAGALLLKTVDGALRPSLHRVGVELLYVPVPEGPRTAAKSAIDVLGVRGGQALASVFILAAVPWGGGNTMLASVAALLCVAWGGVALALRSPYLDLFRSAIREGTLPEGATLPALDLSSLEAAFGALNSRDDGEVLAALELLSSQGRARVVPALLLHHPSKPVVLHTLALLSRTKRVDWFPTAERLLESRDPEIRAAALRARTTSQPDEGLLRRASQDASPLVRATALVGLIGSGSDSDSEEAWRGLRELTATPSLATRIALTRAIEQQPAPAFGSLLVQLAQSDEERLAVHVARAMAKVRSPAFLPTLIGWLRFRHVREAAQEALLEYGEEALAALDEALGDPRSPARVREHVPRPISRFPPGQAIAVLQRHLAAEPDGRVRFKILRGLGRIATDHPEVTFDDALVREVAARTVEAAVETLRWRVGLLRGARQTPSRATAGHRLLVILLRDQESHRVESFFRLLQLLLRSEDVRSIHRGLRNADRRVRAASRELLENVLESVLEEPLRATVLALVEDLEDEQRLARIPGERELEDDYRGLLTLMTAAASPSLRSLAAFYAGELSLPVGSVPGPFVAAIRPQQRSVTNRSISGSTPMAVETNLSTTDRLLYLGRVAWSQARLPIVLQRLSIAAEHMRERAFPRGAVLAREGEPLASCYLLVQGRVQVSRRGTLLGETDPGSLVGLEPLISQDALGLGVVAATDVLALQLDSDTLVGMLEDNFPLVHDTIRATARRLLALMRRLPGLREAWTGLPVPPPHDESTGLGIQQPAGRRMNLVEVLLFLRSPGGPFERSSIDALAELAATVTQVPFRAGHVFWREGEPATRLCLVADGIVACGSSRDGARSSFRVGPGRVLGALESIAGEPRWYDAVAATEGILLEQDVEGVIDLFEDNVHVALDYLAWVSGTALALIERELGPGRELLEFFTAAPPGPTPPAADAGRARPGEGDALDRDPSSGDDKLS